MVLGVDEAFSKICPVMSIIRGVGADGKIQFQGCLGDNCALWKFTNEDNTHGECGITASKPG